jgi:hypothetical protein
MRDPDNYRREVQVRLVVRVHERFAQAVRTPKFSFRRSGWRVLAAVHVMVCENADEVAFAVVEEPIMWVVAN